MTKILEDKKGFQKWVRPVFFVLVSLMFLYDFLAALSHAARDTFSEVIYWDWSVEKGYVVPQLILGALGRHLCAPWILPAKWDYWRFGVLLLVLVTGTLYDRHVIPRISMFVPPWVWFTLGFFVLGLFWPLRAQS